ncbi:hypothetical protein EZL74_07805 [Flavobacterium silvisoli]|uniref:Uncharacterized protein n=1 Tax=Flavobacterium silvisoli TaxID=2529433 RepID=A0A4Q9YXX6_9FLAO|nr:hypothetical protein [Flavobacterium silvisoli]TBX68690.1 hypothetical protein EZL74_07805 [Flavobacterium silvisoli]
MKSTFKYLILMILGFLVMYVCKSLQHLPPSEGVEYRYSSLLKNNYTLLSAFIFMVIGLGAGFFYKLNPWYAGFSLILIFPLVSLFEGTVYRGSHNLIPFEFAMHFFMSLPAVGGVYLGRILNRKTNAT